MMDEHWKVMFCICIDVSVRIPVSKTITHTNDQLETAVKKRIPEGTQKSKQAGFNGHLPSIQERLPVQHSCLKKMLMNS